MDGKYILSIVSRAYLSRLPVDESERPKCNHALPKFSLKLDYPRLPQRRKKKWPDLTSDLSWFLPQVKGENRNPPPVREVGHDRSYLFCLMSTWNEIPRFLCPESRRQSARPLHERRKYGRTGSGRRGREGEGRIIKKRENRRTVSRVAVRAPTKLDYFSQLLPYLVRAPRFYPLSLSPFILSSRFSSFGASFATIRDLLARIHRPIIYVWYLSSFSHG